MTFTMSDLRQPFALHHSDLKSLLRFLRVAEVELEVWNRLMEQAHTDNPAMVGTLLDNLREHANALEQTTRSIQYVVGEMEADLIAAKG